MNEKSYILQLRQGLPLEEKLKLSIKRIIEWYEYHNGNVYVAFSGGKDSLVLLNLVRSIHPKVVAVFNDTGLEYPEIIEFVKTIENVIWLKPEMNYYQVIKKYGYPVIYKEMAGYIEEMQKGTTEKLKKKRLYGADNKNKSGKISNKWQYLINAPFKISDKCCDYLKKKPAEKYEKETGRKAFIGTMAEESNARKTDYYKYGCNSFSTSRQISKPLSFWTEKDIWEYIHKNNIPYSKIYNMGYSRTGCMFCAFGCQKEKGLNKFQLMKQTHSKLYDYCINKLEMGKVLDYIGVNYK